MRRKAAFLLVVAAVLVAGVLGTRRDSHPGAPTTGEAAWVVKWGRWHNELLVDLAELQDHLSAAPAQVRSELTPLRSCSYFSRVVPPAPTRYATAGAAAARACRVVRSLPALAERMLRGDDQASVDLGIAVERAYSLAEDAGEALRVRLSFNRPLPRRGGVTTESRIEPRLSAAASAFVGKPVDVRCWSPADWKVVVPEEHAFYGSGLGIDLVGFAQPGVTNRSEVHLAPDVCYALAERLYDGSLADVQLAYAVEVLTHESEHIVSPPSPEFVTDCYAAQEVDRMARILGIPEATARRLPGLYWRKWYPSQSSEYVSPECRPGGPFDETPGDGVWP